MGAPFSTALKRCNRCLLPETHETLVLDSEGVCNVCRAQEAKAEINWQERLEQLDSLVGNIMVTTATTACPVQRR